MFNDKLQPIRDYDRNLNEDDENYLWEQVRSTFLNNIYEISVTKKLSFGLVELLALIKYIWFSYHYDHQLQWRWPLMINIKKYYYHI